MENRVSAQEIEAEKKETLNSASVDGGSQYDISEIMPVEGEDTTKKVAQGSGY